MTTRDAAYDLYADDYLYVDGVEAWTLTPVLGGAVTDVQGKRAAPTKRRVSPAGEFTQQPMEMQVRLWDATLGGLEPHEDDILTDADAVEYTITWVRREYWDTQWLCSLTRRVPA